MYYVQVDMPWTGDMRPENVDICPGQVDINQVHVYIRIISTWSVFISTCPWSIYLQSVLLYLSMVSACPRVHVQGPYHNAH